MVEVMDRGTDACKNHLADCKVMDIRQTRRGWLQECLLGCEAKSEFKYFIGTNQVAQSLEESEFLMRCCCQPCYEFKAVVKETNTDAELLTVNRPFSCCVMGCKCCCAGQEAIITSNGQQMGKIKEEYFCCVPTFTIMDGEDKPKYKLHSPTCCGGVCVNCFTEGCICGKGLCKAPFWIFDYNQENTDGGKATHTGKILKKPKSMMTEVFTEANAFEAVFPDDADIAMKATLIGASVYINSIFFESDDQ